jgi:hypothetical protein
MSLIEDREFEREVREAMQARPQPHPISNLAYRAMELAREHARALARRQLDGFQRLRRRGRWLGAVAAMLIAIVLAIGANQLSNSNTTVTTFDSASSDSTTTSSGNTTLGILLVAELIVVAMILLSVEAASSRPHGDTLI